MKWCWIGLLLLGSFISEAQIISLFAGTGSTSFSGNGVAAITAGIPNPRGSTFDSYGNYYFADGGGANRIRKIDLSGVITTVAGNGVGGFGGDSGLATSAKLYTPVAVKFDANGNMYIADGGNNRIRKVDRITGIISTIAGTGVSASTGNGGPATVAGLSAPNDICLDKFGNLYISEDYQIRKIDTAGIITAFAGTGSPGYSGDNALATAAQIDLSLGIIADDTGNIYIADNVANVIRKVSTSGIITTFAGNGSPTYTSDGIPAINAQFVPLKIGVDSLNQLYISDGYNERIYRIDLAGIIHVVAGNGVSGYTGNGGLAITAEIHTPAGIAFDACGNLYFPEVNNYRIRKVTFNSGGIPSVIIAATADTVCAGTAAIFTTSVTGSSTFAYNWMVNGSLVGATGSSYTYTPSNGDSVRCIFAGTGQCSGDADTVSSNTLHMVVTPLITPTISVTSPAIAIAGSTVTVTATVVPIAIGSSGYSIKWYDNGVLFATTTTNTTTCTVSAGTNSITATVVPVLGSCYDSATTTGASIAIIKAYNEGIINIATQQPVSIYPNPARNEITVTGSDINAITITNAIGQTLISKDGNAGKVSIDISSLPAGIYLVTVICDNGSRAVSKIVKQ